MKKQTRTIGSDVHVTGRHHGGSEGFAGRPAVVDPGLVEPNAGKTRSLASAGSNWEKTESGSVRDVAPGG